MTVSCEDFRRIVVPIVLAMAIGALLGFLLTHLGPRVGQVVFSVSDDGVIYFERWDGSQWRRLKMD